MRTSAYTQASKLQRSDAACFKQGFQSLGVRIAQAVPIQTYPALQQSASNSLQQLSGPTLLLSKEWEEYVDPVTGKLTRVTKNANM